MKAGTTYMRGLLTGPTMMSMPGEFRTSIGIFGIAPPGSGAYFYSSNWHRRLRTAVEDRGLAKFRDAWAKALPLAGQQLDVAVDLLQGGGIQVPGSLMPAGAPREVPGAHAIARGLTVALIGRP